MNVFLNDQAEWFAGGSEQRFDIEDGNLKLFKQAFSRHDAEVLFDRLRNQIQWRQDTIRIAGRTVPIPRLQAWYGDAGVTYAYSGLSLSPLPWSDCLLQIKGVVETLAGVCFNSVLLNLYRDGRDSMGWHSDDEPELGREPIIASLSLGECRPFVLRHKRGGKGKDRQKLKIVLNSGSLLVMSGRLQEYWQHQIPKTRLPVGERINLTFRLIQGHR